jgi:DNA-binding response OmpR family regulator
MIKNFALVIEDDEDLSGIFTKALQTSGFEVESIMDGQVAEARLKEIVPSVIVIDLHLPHVSGPTLLKQIHANPAFNKTRTIITTADNVQAEIYRDLATIVLIKPILFSQLRDLSARLITA